MSAPLVLLHGWGVSAAVWQPLRERLADIEIVAPEVLPAGDLDQWADALLPLLPADCVVGGWSLGALLAQCLAQRHPQRLRGLLLFAPTPRFVAAPDWPHGLDAATVQGFRDAFQRDPQRTQQRFLALQTLGDAHRHTVTPSLERALLDPQAFRPALARGLQLLADSDLRTHRPPPTLRGLIVHGSADALMPIGAARWLAAAWPACRLLELAACGHAPFLSQPDAVAAEVRAFLQQCAA